MEPDDEELEVTYLTSPEVCRLAGCSYRQLDHWTRNGIIAPTRAAEGSGTVRGWSVEDAAVVRVVASLARLAVPPKIMSDVCAAVDRFPELWGGRILVTADGGVRPSGLASGIDGWHVDLAGCRAHVGAPPVAWPAAWAAVG